MTNTLKNEWLLWLQRLPDRSILHWVTGKIMKNSSSLFQCPEWKMTMYVGMHKLPSRVFQFLICIPLINQELFVVIFVSSIVLNTVFRLSRIKYRDKCNPHKQKEVPSCNFKMKIKFIGNVIEFVFMDNWLISCIDRNCRKYSCVIYKMRFLVFFCITKRDRYFFFTTATIEKQFSHW